MKAEAYYGEAAVLINGKMWTGEIYVHNDDMLYFSIEIIKNDSSGILETLEIPVLKKELGTNGINPYSSIYSNTLSNHLYYNVSKGGDVVLKGYVALDTVKNAYTITRQADDFKEVWGTFAFDLTAHSTPDDTAKFTEGSFHIYPEGKPNQ